MHIAIVKPDYGITGGFELVLGHVEAALHKAGHTVERISVDISQMETDRNAFGVYIPYWVYKQSFEYFRYAGFMHAFEQIDVSRFDAVIPTQPPSFAVKHPRKLALFYHHQRIFYDLSSVYVESGLGDPETHQLARYLVHKIDQPRLEGVAGFLTPSDTVRSRLAGYNRITDNVYPFLAGPGFDAATVASAAQLTSSDPTERGHVLHVGRQEFTKRHELLVHAMQYLPDVTCRMIGDGSRLPWAQYLDAAFKNGELDPDRVGPYDLWLNPGIGLPPLPPHIPNRADPPKDSNVVFHYRVSDTDLKRWYNDALCVVSPSYEEDYGLTAIEAMAYGKPVITCLDSGGLAETVQHEVNGLIVEPTGQAIADAIDRLRTDPDMCAELARNARLRAAEYTWERAEQQLRCALDAVLSL